MLHSILEAFNPPFVYRIITRGCETTAMHVSGAVLEGMIATTVRDSDGGIRHVVEIPGATRIMSAEALEDCQEGKQSGYTLEVV